jgi:hypothetical protein
MLPALFNLVDTGSAFLEKSDRDVKFALDRIPKENKI